MDTGRLVYMANQIARNLAAQGSEHAVSATADHIRAFWEPRMVARIQAYVQEDGAGLEPVVLAALELLKKGGPTK